MIEGGHTRLSRTSHAISYDEKNDEILVPNPLAEAVLVYRGDASGDAAPIRAIQGPHTLIRDNDELALDNVHDELIVPTRESILIFSRTANGDIAPLRTIGGPKTRIYRARGIAVDPVNNIIAIVATAGTASVRSSKSMDRTLPTIRTPTATSAGP